ncbi:integrin beta-4 isoform X3 [Oryzias latipes]|uniref:integrin beta-4 isoform X3 n=1 Tax=Oryzias latipes TaxID=8090 RepID=UPI000CE25F0F|nr:integrin beta-4 isoform X3 [Oryzias latipes]
MGTWMLHLSAGCCLLLLRLTVCGAEANYCFAARGSNCSQCLQAGKGCAYCSEEVFSGPRCDLYENILAFGCGAAAVITAKSSMSIEQNEKIKMSLQQSQVSPQQVSMMLLPGEEKLLDVEVFAPTKGPLDLYILMDFSNSMADDLDNLKKMGNKLAKLVEQLSDDYTIGFGKFVDKVIEPQTDMRPLKLKEPWPNSDSPFSFQSVIRLTSNLQDFTRELQKERISGNLDAPEGGFDAILQAAVCGEKIGWRQHSTHLLVFSTESAFHYEADGVNVLSGILPRNDEQCHLDDQGRYTEATTQDYPSIPTLVRLLGKHNIIPIFAVTNHSYSYYEKLKAYFPIAEVGLLQDDSSNILQVMEEAFKSIRSKMSIRAEERPKAFEAQFLKTSGEVADFGDFQFEPGMIGKFKMILKARRTIDDELVCNMDPSDQKGTMRVKPTTFNAAMSIKASVLCPSCSCEMTPILKSDRCHRNGDLVCGKCQCHSGWLGNFCNCSEKDSVLDTNQCMGPGMTQPCSGRGDCQACGTCMCYNPEQFEGPFCQYDRTQCQRHGGFLCNDRGSCLMGRCACTEGWEGDACECPKSNQTCLDSRGGICSGRGKCVCGRCECLDSGTEMTSTCEPNFQFQLGACEASKSCTQCKAWKTGEKKEQAKCDKCLFKVELVEELKERETVVDSCSFRDEDDDCTFRYTVESLPSSKELLIQVLKDKECPPGGLLWLLPLLLFLLLLLALLLLCCWKYCACCASCWQSCLALLPCCRRGRMVGFKEDEYFFRQSCINSDHLDTPMVRTGPLKGPDVVRWTVTDNVHREPDHPAALATPNSQETIKFPISLRLNRPFNENLSWPESVEAEQLSSEVSENLNEVYKQIPGAHKVKQTNFRVQQNAGKRKDYAIVDTVLAAPRCSFKDIIKLTEKNVQSGSFRNLKVAPGYYTVATDREAAGAVEFQEGVDLVDVHVPLFIKDQDDDKKTLRVEAIDVPLGIAEIGKRRVNITIIKERASSIFSFLQPTFSCSRLDGVASVPVTRDIVEDGRAQVSYRTRDLTAQDKKDFVATEGELTFGPGETQKVIPVPLLDPSEMDGLMDDRRPRQFAVDLSNPRQGAKLGRHPRTTVTITDIPEPSVVMFKKTAQTFSSTDQVYHIPVVCTPDHDDPVTVKWRTKTQQRSELSGPLKFGPGETEKNIVINSQALQGLVQPKSLQLELFDPSSNASLGDRRTTLVNISEEGETRHCPGRRRSFKEPLTLLPSPEMSQAPQRMGYVSPKATSPGGFLLSPENVTAKATGPRNIRLNWEPPPGNPIGYKVKYWIYGDQEKDAEILDVHSPQAELTNLYPYCDYEMKVCAYNALGDGYESSMVPCQTLEDVPGEPGRLAFNVISPTVTQVSWAEPAEPNGVITAYEVLYTPINDDQKPAGAAKKVMIDSPKKRMLLIENLQIAQTYQYKVRAQNKVGWGPFKDATINLASQPTRPLSIPIIPDVPIVDAEEGEEYDRFLMYSNDVLRSPSSSKAPSVSGDGWQHVQLVGSELDLRQVSWGRRVEIIPGRLSTDGAEEAPHPSSARTPLPDHSFLFHGGSTTHNLSTSSSPMSTLSSAYRGAGSSFTTETNSAYFSGSGSTIRQVGVAGGAHTTEVVMRRRLGSRGCVEENIRDSIVMGDASSSFTSFDARVSPGVPDTPSRLVFSALGPTALRVSWQEPLCEKPILSYCVLYQLLSGGELKRINVTDPAENSVMIHDLLPNHSYLFKVKAQSEEGWGPEREGVITIESAVDPRSPLSPVPGSSFTLSTPSAPGPLVFTALSPEALQLSWEKPRQPNGDILGYVVSCEQLHGGGDRRSFQVSGDSAETSLMVPNLTENIPYKFKVQARTTQGFGPEREGIITIESQDGGALSQYSSQSATRREVFQMPTEVSSSHSDAFFSDGMMMTTRHTEAGAMMTRQITRGVVQRSVTGGVSVTREMIYES